jgi:hypothetical protein
MSRPWTVVRQVLVLIFKPLLLIGKAFPFRSIDLKVFHLDMSFVPRAIVPVVVDADDEGLLLLRRRT